MDTDAVLGPTGSLHTKLPGSEHRPEQAAMGRAVAGALAKGQHLLVEAGTGVGKSFGYLVPAILQAIAEKQTIVVSTHTIALQEQLVNKDVPALQRVLPGFRAALVKGRGNYLSLRRLRVSLGRAGILFTDVTAAGQLRDLAQWARTSPDGTKAALRFTPHGSVWDQVQSDHGNCLGRKCPTYNTCFYYKARRAIQGAQILIVNHALFFADLALRRQGGGVLPDYDAVVFDEAHTLEAVAGDHLGLSITQSGLDYLLGRLFDPSKGKGLLALHGTDAAYKAWYAVQEAGFQWFERLRAQLAGRDQTVRFRKPMPFANELSPALALLSKELDTVGSAMSDPEEAIELAATSRQAQGLGESLQAWHDQAHGGHVYWSEPRGMARKPALRSSPIEVGPELKALLFDRVKSVVLTSATLSTGGRDGLRYVAGRLGLDRTERVLLGSPFDYAKQAELHLFRDIPDPSSDPRGFESAAIAKLPALVAGGAAFVLFTSNQFLQNAARTLRTKLALTGLTLLCQGEDGSAASVLERFRRTSKAVLFGVDSFWQGVDVPGDALRTVVIMKLPFAPPDQPLAEARAEAVSARGGSPFGELQVPQACLKLKQGFGRLIRSATDTGTVALLDPRVLTKGYGRQFLEALPPARRFVDGFPG